MKSILSYTKTAIILLLLTAIFLGFYIYMIARPVSFGMTYFEEDVFQGVYFEGKITFYRDGTVRIDNTNFDEPFESYYYFRDGRIFLLIAENEDERIEEIAFIEENFQRALDIELYSSSINAFLYNIDGFPDGIQGVEEGDFVYACKSLFVFAISGGILMSGLVGLTGTSVVLCIKAKCGNKSAKSRKAARREETT